MEAKPPVDAPSQATSVKVPQWMTGTISSRTVSGAVVSVPFSQFLDEEESGPHSFQNHAVPRDFVRKREDGDASA